MSKRKDNIRKLTKTGRSGSFTIVIPAAIAKVLGWREHQRLIIKKFARGVIIRDALTKKRKNKK